MGLALAPAPQVFAEPVTVLQAHYRDILARNGETYRIFVWTPQVEPPKAGFPVVYVTDANAVFGTFAEAINMRSRASASTGIVPAVVVGIGYPIAAPLDLKRRTYDLTPVVSDTALPPRPDGSPWPKTGGADEFLAFVENTVKPAIEKDFRIDKTRETLVGHSFGGLFALHVLFSKPEAFDTYVAGSPSIWFGNNHLVGESEAFLQRISEKPVDADLFLAVGGWEQELSPAESAGPKAEERAKWKARNRMVDNAREMAMRLSGHEKQGLRVTFREFSEEDHTSLIPLMVSRALSMAAGAQR